MAEELFKTTELSLAAYLHALGFEVLAYDRTDPERVVISFTLSNNLNDYVENFRKGDCLISARTFYSSLQSIKMKAWNKHER